MTRTELIEALIEKQKTIIDNLESSVERYQTASDIDEQETREPEDFSRQTEAKDMQLRFEKLLREAKLTVDFLLEQKNQSHERLEKGALVKTSGDWYFLGVSIPSTEINKTVIVSVSDQAPVYREFTSKKIGDRLEVGQQSLEILEIL
ncbi:hypothetical protein ACX3PU_00500 [Chryseobacterium sp. A301]